MMHDQNSALEFLAMMAEFFPKEPVTIEIFDTEETDAEPICTISAVSTNAQTVFLMWFGTNEKDSLFQQVKPD